MTLTDLHTSAARRAITEVNAIDITDPDLPRTTVVTITTRVKELLDMLATHAERQQVAIDTLHGDKTRLETELRNLRSELASRDDRPTAA
ncbi:hypothetical protein KVH31_34730 [Streptomyces olivaceus]|uniref:hypothetical protein n=1 Tax=Streptomyces olivaceus TaxID=47716 RepID=UPI001CCD76FE|nr:hypothetical protein [Streptomyces olivaceus]MBZ6211654.1 hypothetical protein [Streptomyces olivaceus]